MRKCVIDIYETDWVIFPQLAVLQTAGIDRYLNGLFFSVGDADRTVYRTSGQIAYKSE